MLIVSTMMLKKCYNRFNGLRCLNQAGQTYCMWGSHTDIGGKNHDSLILQSWAKRFDVDASGINRAPWVLSLMGSWAKTPADCKRPTAGDTRKFSHLGKLSFETMNNAMLVGG